MTDIKSIIASVKGEPGHPFCPYCQQDDYKLLAEALEIALAALGYYAGAESSWSDPSREALDRIAALVSK